MKIRTFEEAEKDFNRSFRSMIVIGISITVILFVSAFFLINSAYNQIEKEGGLGKVIGNFIGEINSGINEQTK